MTTFTVSVSGFTIDAENPLEAAKILAGWLKDDSAHMVYDVVNDATEEAFSVDLEEDDEDAVLPAGEVR